MLALLRPFFSLLFLFFAACQVAISPEQADINYGRALISNTAQFYGEHGSLEKGRSNGLNCQSCHLEAGTRPYGNNYRAVAATYPKFRPRSNSIENLEFRINDCFRRSLNAEPPAATSHEMRAIKAYILAVGKDIAKGNPPPDAGIVRLDFLPRAADTILGKVVYLEHCALCHQADGSGQLDAENLFYHYPPVWGKNSYTTAAGMYRLSHLAGFVKYNMPHGQATFSKAILTDAEAWDVAAYINSQPRPMLSFPQDFPKPEQKPIDYPFPPYADTFSQSQHKYGPFAPIKAAYKK